MMKIELKNGRRLEFDPSDLVSHGDGTAVITWKVWRELS
jgi:hypothetical protein